jgi:signal transduction histidine kinase
LVTDRTRKQYVASGILKTVNRDDPRDKWYFRVREMSAPYESNVDPDEANRDQLTAFINYRVLDYRGRYLGTTGVGLTLGQVGGHIDRYQSVFNRRIYFVDRQGNIVLAGKSMENVRGSIRDLPGIDTIADNILTGDNAPRQLEYRKDETLTLVNSRYIPELDSYLLVEQDEGEDIAGVQRVLIFNLGIGAALSLLALMVMRRVVDRYQQRLESLSRESLEHAAKETEMAREQQEFVAMVSHEFRTPLAIIDSSLQGLKRHEHGMPNEVSSRYRRILRASLRLQELVNNYLIRDRLQQVHFSPGTERIDIFHLVTRTAERTEWPGMAFNIKNLQVTVIGDAELLRIVFFNILNNAIKYSPIDGQIHIDGAVEGLYAEVRIADAGSGIPPEDLPRIFEKHYRASNSQAGGTGLGLYLVKRIVELHGGTISAESALGQGTTIAIRFPLAPSA